MHSALLSLFMCCKKLLHTSWRRMVSMLLCCWCFVLSLVCHVRVWARSNTYRSHSVPVVSPTFSPCSIYNYYHLCPSSGVKVWGYLSLFSYCVKYCCTVCMLVFGGVLYLVAHPYRQLLTGNSLCLLFASQSQVVCLDLCGTHGPDEGGGSYPSFSSSSECLSR